MHGETGRHNNSYHMQTPEGAVWLAASSLARLSGCSFELFGSLIKRLSQVPVMQPYNSSQARQERGNRAYLASQARPMQRSAHMLWLKGNMHTKRSKRGQITLASRNLYVPMHTTNQTFVACSWPGRGEPDS